MLLIEGLKSKNCKKKKEKTINRVLTISSICWLMNKHWDKGPKNRFSIVVDIYIKQLNVSTLSILLGL